MGNWAEVTAFNGQLSVARFGRSDDLDDAAPGGSRVVTGPADWLERYGHFGFDNWPGGTVGEDPWKNVTVSPDVGSTSQVIAELYPQSGGRRIDGVFYLDIYALSELLRLTGPIDVPAVGATLTADNAAEFLLSGQYEVTVTSERVDLLEDVSERVLEELLSASLPDMATLLDTFGPLVDMGRLAGYSVDPDEQLVIERLDLDGTLVDSPTSDGLAFTFNNTIGNKIDYYLHGNSEYSVRADPRSNSIDADFQLELQNGAPRTGEPPYVIGNRSGKPDGTNRTYVSIYTRLSVLETRLDGEPVVTETSMESGYFVTALYIDLPPEGSAMLQMSLGGPFDLLSGYSLDVRTPPTATPIQLDVSIEDVSTGSNIERSVFRPGHASITLALR